MPVDTHSPYAERYRGGVKRSWVGPEGLHAELGLSHTHAVATGAVLTGTQDPL